MTAIDELPPAGSSNRVSAPAMKVWPRFSEIAAGSKDRGLPALSVKTGSLPEFLARDWSDS